MSAALRELRPGSVLPESLGRRGLAAEKGGSALLVPAAATWSSG